MIDDIKKDRADWTPGPWTVRNVEEREFGSWTLGAEHSPVFDYTWESAEFYGSQPSEVDARRIARVPDMEDAIIALTEENARLREAVGQATKLLAEAVSDLTAYVENDWSPSAREAYPALQHKYDRDMALCREISAFINHRAALKGETE